MFSAHLDPVAMIIVAVFTGFACIWDYKTRKLPNWLTVPMFALGLIYHVSKGVMVTDYTVWSALQFSLVGFATGFGLLFLLMLIGGGGGGDVKFMAALGSWVGAYAIIFIFVGSAIVAVFSLFGVFVWRLISRASGDPVPAGVSHIEPETEEFESPKEQVDSARQIIPYAVTVCIASWLYLALKFVVISSPPN